MCTLGVLCCVCGVLGHLAPLHQCARSVRCVACVVSLATWLLFISHHARRFELRVRCPGPLSSYSPVCSLGALCCVCSVLGHLAPVHQCASSACCAVCAVAWPLCSCSPVCTLGALCCVCGVLGHLPPVHRCAPSEWCAACAVSWATWLLFTGVHARCVVFCVRCPQPLSSCLPVSSLGALSCVCGVLDHSAPVHRCASLACCVACAVSWATWPLFTGVRSRCVVLRVQCPGPLGSCSPVCFLGVCVACAVSWATWLLFTGVHTRHVVLCVRCPGPLGSCSPVCSLDALCCVCGVLDHLAPAHRCARSVLCVARVVSWATWLLFTGVLARRVALYVQCPGPLGSCSPVCMLGVLRCVCGVLGHLAPVHRSARSVRCVACVVSWATCLLFTGVRARPFEFRVRCPGPLGSYSPLCSFGALRRVCGVLRHLAPVHRCTRSVRCVPCAGSWATWLLFIGGLARCFVLFVRCPGPLGSCSPVFTLGVLCCICGVLGHLAPVHRCASSACCAACAVAWPLCSCSPVCTLGALCSVRGVMGHLAPVHWCSR